MSAPAKLRCKQPALFRRPLQWRYGASRRTFATVNQGSETTSTTEQHALRIPPYEKISNRFWHVQKLLNNRPLTLAEKILYSHLENAEEALLSNTNGGKDIRGNAILALKPDRVAMQDASAQMALLQFMSCGLPSTAVPASIHCDHMIVGERGADVDLPASISGNKEVFDFLESAAKKYGIEFWAPGAGIIHQTVLENYAAPGLMMLGTDSHTPNAGGLGAIAIGVGGADAVDALVDAPWELKAPRILGVELTGKLSGWTTPKDVILKLAGLLTVRGGTGFVIEYMGEGVQTLSCTGMATICNMGAEVGATTSLFPYTQLMRKYLQQTNRIGVVEAIDRMSHASSSRPYLTADPDAEYDEIITLDLSSLEPHINGPFTPDLSTPLSHFKEAVSINNWPTNFTAGLIGSCTNSSYEDMTRAEDLVKQANAAGLTPKIPFYVTPGSEQIRATLERDSTLQTFSSAGGIILANACGPCIGQWARTDEPSRTEPNAILTSYNRNFKGRNDGNPQTMNFLASPEIVTAMSYSGSTTFNPLTDTIPTPSGTPFRFSPPTGFDLPSQGFEQGNPAFQPTPAIPSPETEILVSPTSLRLAILEPFQPFPNHDLQGLRVLYKVRGQCTTDTISAAGPWLKYKGHLPNISANTLIGAVNAETGETNTAYDHFASSDSPPSSGIPELAEKWRDQGHEWLVVAEDNYGEGSAREHAALQPRFLGGRVILAKSFARIHEANLKKQGVVPLTFADKSDYDRIGAGDLVDTVGLLQCLRNGGNGEVKVKVTGRGSGEVCEFGVKHTISKKQAEFILAGSALNLSQPGAALLGQPTATTSSIIKKRKLSTKSDPKSPASSSLKSPIPLAGKSFTRREGRSPTSLLPSKDASRALAGSSSQVTPNSPLSQSSTASDERLISTEKDTKGGGSETENVERAHPTEGIAGDRRVPTDAQAYDKTKSTKAGRSYAASLKAMDRPASPAKRPRSEIEEAPKDGKATNVEENGSDAPQQQSQGLADSIESQDDVNTSVQSSTRPQPNRHTRDLSVDMFAGEQESTSDQSTPQVLHPFKNSTSLAAGAYVSPQSAASSDTSTASTTSKTSAASDVSSEQREDVPSIDEQIEQVQSIVSGVPVSEGMKGYIISMSWLNRVKSRSSQKGSETFDKSTLVGPIGPVDNSNITLVLDASMAALKDETGEQYVPLRPGLQVSDDFEILPPSAWELIIKWYGLAKGSSVITRYCHNTSTSDTSDNLQFELYPLILTILKLPDRSGGLNLESMKEKNTKAVKLVASRSERFQNFLKRAKEEAGINLKTKVRMWMAMSPAQAQDFSEPGMLTPAHSRSSSPNPPPRIPPPIIDPNASLSLDLNDFAELQKKVQLEPIEIKDETANEKYNGHTDLGFYFLGQDSLLILEEQVGGPAGGEWVSNLSAKTKKGSTTGVPISITKNGTTKVQSRNHSTSGRSSPAPNTGMMTRGRAKKNGKIIGTVGLTNLGNTCYMNSALQCVRSVHELTEYFLQGLYKSDLNPRNPLAHNGDVAKSYAALLRELYSDSSYGAFAPRAFKAIIGRYGPSFSGYGQQDSQEFLGFLLDGLQEDLNRIHSKPYIEKPDSTDEMVHNPQALREMADTCWDIYKKRNNSVITDLFAGMYKSTVVCPVCDKVSIIFDPFNTLTLQLPIENLWSRSFVYFPICAPPVQISVDIDKNATFSALKEMVGKKTGADAKRLMIAEVYKSKFFKTFEDRKSIAEERIQDADEICIYELEDVPTNYPVPTKKKTRSMINIADEDEDALDADSSMADKMLVPLFHRGETDSSTAAKPRRSFFAYPSFIIVTREEAQSQDAILQKALMNAMTMTTFDLFPSDGSSDEQVQPEEADTVIMNNDDLDSSSDSKINASSIQSEDGMVDVTVGGSTAKPAESQLPRISYPPNYPRSIQKRPLPQLLKSGEYIPAQYRELFDMKTYSGKSIIPIGWSSMADDGQYVPLEDRLPKRASAPKKTSVAHQAALRAMNQESPPSSDEDEPIEVPTMAAPISDDEDMSDGIPEIENPANAPSYSSNNGFSRFSRSTPRNQAGRLITYSRKDKAKRNGGNKQISRASTEDGERDSGDPVALLRLGDALVLDWRTSTFDTLFYENGPNGEENMRGSPTWNQAPQIADPELDEKRLTRSRRRKNGVSLEDCLDEFGKEEILSENDAWYCPRCKEHRRASKRFELWKAPDILIMHLKRFSAQGRFRDKLDVKVDFPVEGLDLSSRVVVHEEGKELVYDLFAVDNHYGGLGGGHYTAFAKNYNDDAWYEYNDSQVSRRSDPKYVVTSSAYLLFYRRRSTAPLGGPIFENFFAFEDEDEDEVAEETYDDLESVNTDDLDPLLLPKLGSENVSRAESPGPSGEGQRLDDRSCNGSLSASRGLGATRQTVTGAPEAGVAGGALAALASARAAPGAVGHQASSGNSREVDMGSGISELPAYSNVPAKPRIVRNYSLKDEQLKATWGFDLANSQEYDVTQDGDEDGAETMDWKDAGIIQSNNLDDMIPDAVSEDLFDGASTKALSSNGGSDMSGSPQRPFADVDFGGMTHEEYEQLEDEGYDFPPVPEDENLEDRQRYGTPVESGPSAAAAAAGTEVDVDTDAGSSPVQIRGGAGSLSTGKGKGKGTTGLTQQMQLAGLTGYASETDDEK